MKLLVTGGAGFIGSHFINLALQDAGVAKVVNLDCLTYAGDLGNVRQAERDPRYVFEQVDLRDSQGVARVVFQHEISHVVHCAAETHVDRSIADAGAFVTTNINGTYHLVESCRRSWTLGSAGSTTNVFVHVSTDEVYGSLRPEDLPCTEQSPLQPNSPYAASKAAADLLVRSYVQTHLFPAIITRCSNNYGPRQHQEKLIPTVLNCLVEQRPIPIYGNGLQVRDWIHVNDHCQGLWRALKRGRVGSTINFGGGNEWVNLRLVEWICDIHDELRPSRARSSSRELIEFVSDRPGHDLRYAIDARRAGVDLNWKPERSFERGLRDLVMDTLNAKESNVSN